MSIFVYFVQFIYNLIFHIANYIIILFICAIGLMYLILKYYVDKYNIYNVHHPTSLRGRQTLHRNAINFVMIGAFMLQVTILCYLVLRKGIYLCIKWFTEVVKSSLSLSSIL